MQRRIVIAMEHRKRHRLPKAPQTVRLKQSVLGNERLREIASVAAAAAAFYPACNDRRSIAMTGFLSFPKRSVGRWSIESNHMRAAKRPSTNKENE